MAEMTRSRAQLLSDLQSRLERLETLVLQNGKKVVHPAGGKAGIHHCTLPQVAEREIPADVSPERARLIRMVAKKWVNGTKLRYCFLDSAPHAGPESQKSK